MATEEVRSVLDLVGDPEHNQIDASHEEDDDYKAYLELYSRGFKFVPDDGQLIVRFLKAKVDNRHLPHNLIKEVTLYDNNPKTLSESYKPVEDTWYFFTLIKRKHQNGRKVNRKANNGTWHSTGGEVPVSFENVKVGCKRTLVFYEGERPGKKTNWIMHEYKVVDPENDPNDKRLDHWVLCKLYQRTTKSDSKRQNDIRQRGQNKEDVTFNTLKRQNFGSNDTMFDDSITLSRPLEQKASINPDASVAMNVENAGINTLKFSQYPQYAVENVDVEFNQCFPDAVENIESNQYFQYFPDVVENIGSNDSVAMDVENSGFNILENFDVEFSQYSQDAIENANVVLDQYVQDWLSEIQMGGELPF